MPWKESSVMKERRRFVARLLDRLSRVQRPRMDIGRSNELFREAARVIGVRVLRP